jgi:serine/threonine protein kinase
MDELLNPCIADFGVSREKYGTSTMTRIGTPTYCAPEILSGEHYSLPVDIYSFGILIYEMINGKAPWKSENLTAIQLMMRVAIKKERPPIPEGTEPDLERLIKSCWDHEPNNRPTADDMITMFKTEDGLKTYFTMKSKKIITQVITTQVMTQPISTQPITQVISSTLDVTNIDSNSTSRQVVAKPPCLYDAQCYRKKLTHFDKYSHPRRSEYEQFVKSFIKDKANISSENKCMIETYRNIKGVSDKAHSVILEQCGWTTEEFDAGYKEILSIDNSSLKNQKRKRSDSDSDS